MQRNRGQRRSNASYCSALLWSISCPPQVIELVEAGRDRVLAEEPEELFRGEPEWS